MSWFIAFVENLILLAQNFLGTDTQRLLNKLRGHQPDPRAGTHLDVGRPSKGDGFLR